jgi:hypothetical protein
MFRFIFIGVLATLLCWGCAEGFDINAPQEDIWVVYGTLNPDDSLQYIRVSKAFQPRSNALDSARIGEFTVRGLNVQLKGADQVYQARQVDSVLRQGNGDFGPVMTLYEFRTAEEGLLQVGERYELQITADSLEGFSLQAACRIPSHPRIVQPVSYGNFNRACLSTAFFEDSVEVLFRKQSPGEPSTAAEAFEIRVIFEYRENGEEKTFTFGPSRLFNGSKGCSSGQSGTLCYNYGSGIVFDGIQTALRDTHLQYTYRSEPSCAPARAFLPQSVRIQVTAVDSALGTYMLLNDPGQRDFTSYRPEFTNISGTERGVGIFGAIAVGESPVALSACARYKLRLNGIRDSSLCQ